MILDGIEFRKQVAEMTDHQPAISFEGQQLCSWFESLDSMLI